MAEIRVEVNRQNQDTRIQQQRQQTQQADQRIPQEAGVQAGQQPNQQANRQVAVDTKRPALQEGQKITGQTQYGNRIQDRTGAFQDQTKEGINMTANAKGNVLYQGKEGAVIAKNKPWSQEDEETAASAMQAQAGNIEKQRKEQQAQAKEDVEKAREEQKERIEAAQERNSQNMQEQTVNKVGRAVSSVQGVTREQVNVMKNKAENAPTTYAGVSEASLKKMVQEGRLSQQDYDKEIKARDEKQKEELGTTEKASGETTKNEQNNKTVDNGQKQVGDTDQTKNATTETRQQAVQSTEVNQSADQQRQRTPVAPVTGTEDSAGSRQAS
ncbi:MAG: hypothetical protein IJT34_12020 [Butyrivibrio sp.]|nr:hypothetical protein [Butyrivibrio sp.]